MQQIGTITLRMEGASAQETERIRYIIHLLFEQGFFAAKNGPAVVDFDPEGMPSKISTPRVWVRGKSSTILAQSMENVSIEIQQK